MNAAEQADVVELGEAYGILGPVFPTGAEHAARHEGADAFRRFGGPGWIANPSDFGGDDLLWCFWCRWHYRRTRPFSTAKPRRSRR